jgi:hypothetical protein
MIMPVAVTIPQKASAYRSMLLIVFLAVFCLTQSSENPFSDYHRWSPEEIVATIRTELASQDPFRRDQAIIFLFELLNTRNSSPYNQEIMLLLAEDRAVVTIASDIVADRLAGWYEERETGNDRSMPLYYPLMYVLSISSSKITWMTMLMAEPMVGFDSIYRQSLLSNKEVLKIILSKLATIENKLCCSYPGRELISTMQAIDLRLNILDMHLQAAKDSTSGFRPDDGEMKKFLFDCLQFGDGNRGHIIRSKAGSCIGQNMYPGWAGRFCAGGKKNSVIGFFFSIQGAVGKTAIFSTIRY